jgi:hypothetical protein
MLPGTQPTDTGPAVYPLTRLRALLSASANEGMFSSFEKIFASRPSTHGALQLDLLI